MDSATDFNGMSSPLTVNLYRLRRDARNNVCLQQQAAGDTVCTYLINVQH